MIVDSSYSITRLKDPCSKERKHQIRYYDIVVVFEGVERE